MLKLIRQVEGVRHKLFMDNYFSLPQLFSDLHNGKGMPANSGPKVLKLKKRDLLCEVKVGTSAICWKDKQEVYLLTLGSPGNEPKKKKSCSST
jgi:hypothetical protein